MDETHVLVVGAGFGGVEAATRLARDPEVASVTLVGDGKHLIYRPWLIFLPAQEKTARDILLELDERPLGGRLQFVDDEVTHLEMSGTATLASGRQLEFTHAIVAAGAQTDTTRFPGSAENAFHPCSYPDATAFSAALRRLDRGVVSIVISAERPGPGLEYAGWAARMFEREREHASVQLNVIDDNGFLEAIMGDQAFRKVVGHFEASGHTVTSGDSVRRIGASGVELGSGRHIPSEIVAVVGPLRGVQAGLPSDAVDGRGFVPVETTLRLVGSERVYAIGDITAMPNSLYLPKSMVMARLQARLAAENISRSIRDKPPNEIDFDQVKKYLVLMPDIGGYTVLCRNQRLIASGRAPLLVRSILDWRVRRGLKKVLA